MVLDSTHKRPQPPHNHHHHNHIIIIILIITCMQGIYDYIPETNHVSMVYSVVAVVCLQFMLHIIERNASSGIISVTFLIIPISSSSSSSYDMDVSCHRPFLSGTSLEPSVIPTAQASSFTLQYFPYYVSRSKYNCFL